MNKVADLTGLSRFWANVDKRKANKDGVYSDLMVGDLVGRGESVPAEFSFRASGGKSIKDGTAWIKRLKGNSVVWNQSCKPFSAAIRKPNNGEESEHGASLTNWEEFKPYVLPASLLSKIGHKCVLTFSYTNTSPSPKFAIEIAETPEMRHYYTSDKESVAIIFDIVNSAKTDNINVFPVTDQTGDVAFSNLHLYDLTQMFGAGNEPTTIEEFYARKPIVEDEYAYNAGEVIHMTAEGIKSVGDNAWDEQWEVGGLSEVTGQEYDTTNNFRSKNYIKILPNTQYYFKKPAGVFLLPYYYDEDKNFIATDDVMFTGQNGNAFTTMNAAYMRFIVNQGNYGNDIMLTLVHSGWKQDTDAGYQPYWQDILPLPIIRKYFPNGMVGGTDASGNRGGDIIYYDKASKKWYAQTNMLLLNLDMSNVGVQASNIADYTTFLIPADNANQCKTYGAGAMFNNYGLQTDTYYGPRRIYTTWDNKVSISIPSTMASDVGELQALYQQMPLIVYAELAEPIVTELDAEDQNFRDYYQVADFGTEQSQSSVPSAAFSADIIYQFNAVDMIREHELEITELQSIIATMQAQLASLTSNNE